jgi:hypothetical protein
VQYVYENKETSAFRRRVAESYLARLDFDSDRLKLNSWVKERRFSEARALLQRRVQEGLDSSVRRLYDSLQLFVDESDDFYGVVDLWRAKRWQELSSATASFLQKYPRSSNRRQIERLHDQAETMLARYPVPTAAPVP